MQIRARRVILLENGGIPRGRGTNAYSDDRSRRISPVRPKLAPNRSQLRTGRTMGLDVLAKHMADAGSSGGCGA